MPETDIMTKTNTYNNYCNLAATTLYVDNYEQSTANGVTTTFDAGDDNACAWDPTYKYARNPIKQCFKTITIII